MENTFSSDVRGHSTPQPPPPPPSYGTDIIGLGTATLRKHFDSASDNGNRSRVSERGGGKQTPADVPLIDKRHNLAIAETNCGAPCEISVTDFVYPGLSGVRNYAAPRSGESAWRCDQKQNGSVIYGQNAER
jgi:hypothetical protein